MACERVKVDERLVDSQRKWIEHWVKQVQGDECLVDSQGKWIEH